MHLSQDLQPVLLELALADASKGQTRVRPEEQELQKLIDERTRMTEASASAQLAVDDMELEILRIQEDERKLKKRELDDKRQLSAEIDPERRKDLEHDRYAAKSRIADLLSELKEAHNEIAALRNNRDIHAARVDELNRKVEVAQRTVDALPEEEVVDTDELRSRLPEDVLKAYDNIGAAKFNGRACGGCFIQLPPSERAEVLAEPEDTLPACPNCGTLLVRVNPATDEV